MSTPQTVDTVVIGAGVAGRGIATSLAEAGQTVACVERRAFGGTCELRGCEPKKLLWEAAHAVDRARRLAGHGIVEAPRMDWSALAARVRETTEPVPDRARRSLSDAGVRTLEGEARLDEPGRVVVRHRDGKTSELIADHVVVAVGARPTPLPIDGSELLATSADFLHLKELPRDVSFVGGGYIGMELAFIASLAGANVRVLHRGHRPLPAFGRRMAEATARSAAEHGIDLRVDTEVAGLRADGDRFEVRTAAGETFSTDLVVHAAGRTPDMDALGASNRGLEVRQGRLVVDDRLRATRAPEVLVAGDAAWGDRPLTPVAGAQATVVVGQILGRGDPRFEATAVPTVVFTHPPAARVGRTVDDVVEGGDGDAVEVRHGDASSWKTAGRQRATTYAYEVIVERSSDAILGASIAGPHAEETIHLFALAMREGIPAARLADLIPAFPTAASDVSGMLSG